LTFPFPISNLSSIHACPDKDECDVYRGKVIKKEIGLD